ncbi:restriction endonuclease subunit S [Nitrosomonas sp.]|uniref:restriction endonuclease subunit S n=1 Tax=Nitrosomonas sp. TaxID=42353 RepID=UPI001DD8F3FA|nr:restriction endonuclease subunit S [Nitrosomonas sp.]MCB1948457.1 restriction endonuclease subunit S [Nitrosomonas sp.]
MHVPEGWRKTKIADIAHIQVGRDLNESAYSEIKTNEYRFPVYSNTVENRGLYGYYNFEEYPGNSVTIVGRGIGLGTAFSRKKGRGFGAIGRLLVVNPIHNSFDVDFFANYVNFRLIIFNESGGIPQLPGSQIAKYHVVLPPLPEQQKIAQILSTWDKAIEKLHTLITAKQKRKKALMQQLLTGKKRFAGFEGEWKYKHLAEISYIDAKTLSNSTDPNYTFKYISLSDVQEGKINENLKTFTFHNAPSRARRVVHTNDIIIATVRPNLQGFAKIKEVKSKTYIASTGFSTIASKADYSQDYIYHYLFSSHIVFQINALVVGSNYPAINSSDVRGLHILCPGFKEQQKIASVLSAADKEIETHQKQLSALKQQKKGLMQQLLTGKKRVKTDEPVQMAAAGA